MLERIKERKATLLLFSILLLLIFGSVVVDVSKIDIVYLVALLVFIIKFIYLKK